jgi:hypothetical protein
MEGGRLIKGKMEALSSIVIQLGGAARAGFSSIDQCDRLRTSVTLCNYGDCSLPLFFPGFDS